MSHFHSVHVEPFYRLAKFLVFRQILWSHAIPKLLKANFFRYVNFLGSVGKKRHLVEELNNALFDKWYSVKLQAKEKKSFFSFAFFFGWSLGKLGVIYENVIESDWKVFPLSKITAYLLILLA